MIGRLQQHQMVQTHGDPFARKVKAGTSDAAGKTDTLLLSQYTRDDAPTAAMMVRHNWNATQAPGHFGAPGTYGVHAESLDKFPSLKAVIRVSSAHSSDLVVSDAHHLISAVIPLGVDAGSRYVEGPITGLSYQKAIDADEGYLTLNGKDTFRLGDGKMEPVAATGVAWWSRDYRAHLRQDG